MPRTKLRTTDEAMLFHNTTRPNAEYVRIGRLIAVELCAQHGSTTGREVADEMERRGHIQKGESRFWTGAIFRHSAMFVAVGKERYSDASRNCHQSDPIRWKLSDAYVGKAA